MTNPASTEQAKNLMNRAEDYANLRTESDLRHHLWVFFEPWATEVLGLHQSALAQEGTAASGRYDSRIGRALIEYKKPKLLEKPAERRAAAIQALGYVADPTIGADVVIITDGKTWAHHRDPSADMEVGEQSALDLGLAMPEPEDHFIWRENEVDTFIRILGLIATVRTDPVTATNVADKLGVGRAEVLGLIGELAKTLAQREPDDRTDTLFRQWIQLAGVSYGIKQANDPWPNNKDPDALLGESLAKILKTNTYAESLFTLHTYVALASKLIGMEILSVAAAEPEHRPTSWISLPIDDLKTKLMSMEDGTLSAQLRSPGLLAGDFFGWYAHPHTQNADLDGALRGVLNLLDELAWARLANSAQGITSDILRQFYMSVVPRPLRRALGEFFTPQWLAERTLFRSVELAGKVDQPCRTLDPSCGSGTFLVAALRREIEIQDRLLPDDRSGATTEALSNIIGFDINPVAVLMSRINILLCLADRIESVNHAIPQVYQADSILLPDPLMGQRQMHQQTPVMRLPLTVGEIDVPESLATLDRMRTLRRDIEHAIKNGRSVDDWLLRVRPTVESYNISDKETNAVVEATAAIYRLISKLNTEGRNGVWARVIEQAFAPVILERVELVVGNPPWINWKHLPEAWQERSESLWKTWDLWATKTRASGIPLSDIASLLLARSIATYAKPGAIVGFLVPESLLIGDPGNERIRRCHLRSDISPELNVPYCPVAVDDWTEIKPFSPDAQNKPIGIYIRTHDQAKWPIPKTTWHRAQPRERIKSESHWHEVSGQVKPAEVKIRPVEKNKITSPWVVKTGLKLLAKGHHTVHYTWGQGFHTRGADGYFTVKILSQEPRNGMVLIQNVPDVGKNTKDQDPRTGEIEAQFLWPLVRGKDVNRFSLEESGLYAVLPHDPKDLRKVLSLEDLAKIGPGLWDFLEGWIPALINRSPYGKVQPSNDYPWGIHGPTEHLKRDLPIALSRYMHSTKQPPSAVCSPSMDKKLGFKTVCYPNNKSNIYVAESTDEARYLVGWINATPSRLALSRLASSTTISPVMLNRLPIPKYDPNETSHQEITRIVRSCEGGDFKDVKHLDRLVKDIAIQ